MPENPLLLPLEGLSQRDLSTDRGQQRMLAQYDLMQRGLVYPAAYARFATFWRRPGRRITRGRVRQTVQRIRRLIHHRFGDTNTTAVVGVHFALFRKWCAEEEDLTVPDAIAFLHPTAPDGEGDVTSTVFADSLGTFQDSQGDLWFHIKSDRQDYLEPIYAAICAELENVIDDRRVYQDCNRRSRAGDDSSTGRVLGCRFAENLNNPADPITVSNHTLVGLEDIDHAGASVVIAQRFLINWDQLHQMTELQIEDLIGRTTDDIILPDRDTRSHIKSARQQDEAGNTTFVMRLGLPFGQSPYAADRSLSAMGNNRGDEEGIYFAGFARSVQVLERIMSAQIGDTPGFMNDRLLNHVRSDLGGFFYITSRADLGITKAAPWKEWGNWRRFPGIDWSKLSRHFQERSDNGLMFYNHKNYLYEMATAQEGSGYKPPSTRILTLLMDMFARWQDTWYFEKDQGDLGHLCEAVARDFGPQKAGEVMGLSVMERKGWATRMTCRIYATKAYGFRGRKLVDGRLVYGADTFRIHPAEIIVGALPDLSLGQGRHVLRYLRADEQQSSFFAGLTEASGVGHVLPDHQKLVDVGLGGLIADARARRDAATDADRRAFYSAVELSLLGVVEHLERYAALASEQADGLARGQSAEKDNLRDIAARCRRLMTDAPQTMVEAAQLIFTFHTCLHLNGEPVSIGRLDQYLGRFYEADLAAGRLDEDRAQEIIDALWVKLSEKILQNRIFIHDHQPYGNLAMGGASGPYPQGASLGQWIMQVTVGGVTADDGDTPTPAYNAVSTLCIRASGRLPLTAPCLSLRVSPDTPRPVLEEAAKALLSGGAHPILMQDDKIIPGLLACGSGVGDGDPDSPTDYTPVSEKAGGRWDSSVSLSSARNYACDGCYEPMFTGQNWFALGGFSSLNPLECALNQGRLYASAGDAYLKGQNLSFRSPAPEDIDSFEQLLELYFEHFAALWAKAFDGQLSTFDALASFCPAPLLSVLTDGCMDKGLDIHGGGARYNVYGPCWIALSTTINSLYSIKKMVFDTDTAVTSLAELVECLLCDWGNNMTEPFVSSLLGETRIAARAERYRRLREVALSQPRYGRGHPEVDALGNAIVARVAELTVAVLTDPAPSTAKKMLDYAMRHGTPEHPFGGFQITPGIGTFENFVQFGVGSGASADGRRCNAPIASDLSPSPSPADLPPQLQEAPFSTALESFSGDGAAAMWDGAPTDFNIAEDFPADILADMLQKFAAGIGSNLLTVTVASPETFAQAPGGPEQYDLLRVRMGGWSEYFTSMFPVSQQQHLRRPLSTPE